MEQLSLTQEWDKVFPKSEKVDHCKVTLAVADIDADVAAHPKQFSDCNAAEVCGHILA